MGNIDISGLLDKIKELFVNLISKFQSIGFVNSFYLWLKDILTGRFGMDENMAGNIVTYGVLLLLLVLFMIILIIIISLACTSEKRHEKKEAKVLKKVQKEEAQETKVDNAPASEGKVEEQTPVEEPKVEEAPTEEKVEEPVKEEPKAEEVPVVEEKAEETQVEEKPIEEAPTEEKAEEPVKEEPKAEEVPVAEEKAEEPVPVVEPAKEEKVEEVTPVVEEPKVETAPVVKEKAAEPVKEEVPVKKNEPSKKKSAKEATVIEVIQPTEKPKGIVGKYEVFPVNDVFLYRLKASNGEILVVSEIYKTSKGAVTAIETVKKNIELGKLEISQDKRGRWQFTLFAANKRLLVASSNYTTKETCERASESFKRFAINAPINILSADDDHLMEKIDLYSLLDKPNGKIIITENEGVYEFRLHASNGTVMATSFEFKNKAAVLNGVATFKEAIKTGQFFVVKDKNDMYQFKLYSSAGRCVVIGETYKNKSQACNAASSVNAFINLCEVVDKA